MDKGSDALDFCSNPTSHWNSSHSNNMKRQPLVNNTNWQVQPSSTNQCKKCKWFDETFQKAINAITNNGMKVTVASKVFGFFATSSEDHLYGGQKQIVKKSLSFENL